jgi:aspartate aminotransferase-like enzyme
MMPSKPRLLTPGPTPLPEEVRQALALDMIHHRKPRFTAIMDRVQSMLRTLFGTSQPVLPLSCSGTGAMQAAVSNLFAPGETVLVVEGGKFGQRWRDIAVTHGLEVLTVQVQWGQAVEPLDIEHALQKSPHIKGVLVQASETSTGVLHPLRQIARLTSSRDCLLVVDGISAVGISPCPMDELGIDGLLTGSQKGLMLPPGLALISLSPRAWERAAATPNPVYALDLLLERKKNQDHQTAFTTPVNLIRGLEASLEILLEKGLDAVYQTYWGLTQMTRSGVKAMGLECLAGRNYTWGLTSVSLPEGVDGRKVLSMAQQDYNVVMAGGQDHLKGKIVRIGHMGYVDWADILAGLHALAQCLSRCGAKVRTASVLDQAMLAYEQARFTPFPDPC